jgi:hypothetical protein
LIGATLVLVLPGELSFRLLTSTDLSTALFVLHAIASSIALREVGADQAPRKNFSEELFSLACAIPLAVQQAFERTANCAHGATPPFLASKPTARHLGFTRTTSPDVMGGAESGLERMSRLPGSANVL